MPPLRLLVKVWSSSLHTPLCRTDTSMYIFFVCCYIPLIYIVTYTSTRLATTVKSSSVFYKLFNINSNRCSWWFIQAWLESLNDKSWKLTMRRTILNTAVYRGPWKNIQLWFNYQKYCSIMLGYYRKNVTYKSWPDTNICSLVMFCSNFIISRYDKNCNTVNSKVIVNAHTRIGVGACTTNNFTWIDKPRVSPRKKIGV